MTLLITPAQVAEAAFRAPDFITPEAVAEATIIAAQQKFIRPVLGRAFFDAVCRGVYPAFAEQYVRPPLALYVKMLMMPSLAVRAGAGGVAEINSRNMVRAGDAKLSAALRCLRSDASALMRLLTEHVESSPELYPEYERTANILNRRSVAGGIVL